jgi:pimeloyl-ACP methyl ester carboxylesterase
MIAALIDFRSRSTELRIGGDIIVVALAGLFSIPPLGLGPMMGAVIAVAGAGYAVDSLMVRSPKPARIVNFLVLLFIACVVTGMATSRPVAHVRSFGEMLSSTGLTPAFRVGLTPMVAGNRVVLETGAVAWIEYPAGKGPFPGALVFHGNHPDGSRQPSAVILRRALLDAGFVVLSVDHPGYGESPSPSPDAEIAEWDPLPTVLAAFKTLRATPAVKGLLVVGHSMGTADVLRLLGAEAHVDGAILFGGSLNRPRYNRFHKLRQMRNYISKEKYREIHWRFYDRGRKVEALSPDVAPILFVRFGFEHSNGVATRDMLFEAIPGVKATWDFLDSTHYFNSFGVLGVVVGDTQITQLLASQFRLLAAELRS